MCDQTQVSYLPGDIVWVKLSSLWWPAEVQDPSKLDEEVTSGLKKQPLAIVKFFNEDAYEYPKNLDQIYHYNCLKKDEFIQKGLDLVRAAATKTPSRSVPSSIDKFPADVSMAEEKTNGDPLYINNPKFAHLESNLDETKEDAPSEAKQSHKRSRISTISSTNLTTPSPRAKFSVKKVTPKTISKNNLSGSKTPSSLSRKNRHTKMNASNLSEPKFTCYICESFEAQHMKCLFAHIAAHYMGDLSKRPPVIPRRYLSCFNENEKRRSQKPSEPEISKSQEKRKRKKSEELASKKSLSGKQQSDSSFPPKKRNKKPNTPPPEDMDMKQEVALEILKDWSDSDDEVELKKDTGTKPDTSSPLKSSHSPKSVTTTPTKAEKSCFDFEDNEDSLNVDGALKFGQKLPRVLHEKHSSNRLRTSSKSDENQDELSKQVDNFLETINVPEIPDTITSLKEDLNMKSGLVESEISTKKTNSTNKILKSSSQEDFDSLKKKKSDTSPPAIESVSSLSPVKQKHPVKRSLSSNEKDSKQSPDEPKDKKARKKYHHSEQGEVPENIQDETKETKIHGKESEPATDNKGDTSNEDNHKENKKKETLESSFADEKTNNSSPHFLSINEVKMKPPEKSKRTSKSDHKKEFPSDKEVVSKSGKTHSESPNREKHDRKVKTKDKDLDFKNENQKSPSKSDKHGASKISKESMPEKGAADPVEHSAKHCSDISTKDVVSKSKLETDKSPKKVEHSSKHEKGGKHKSEIETTASEKGDKSTKQSSAKLVEQEGGKITQPISEKLVKVRTDKSEKKQADKLLEKDHHSIQKKQEKIKRVEKHTEKEKKLDSKDKHDIKKKLENEKSKSDSKKQKKHKVEINENTSNSEQNKNSKKIKKSAPKESMKVDHKSDKKSNQTDCAKESANSFAIDLEKKVSQRKSEDVELEPLKSHPSEKKNVGDLNLEKTFIKTSSSTFLSEPDIQTDFDPLSEVSNVSSQGTLELPCHPSSTTTTKQDAELAASSSMPAAQEVCQEPVTTSSDLEIEELITTLNTNSVNVELEQAPLPEHSLTQPESSELLPSQSLETNQENSCNDLVTAPSEGINEIIKNQEKECLVSTSVSEPLYNETSKEKSQLEQTEINSSPLEKSSNISEVSDQTSEFKNDVSEKISSLEVEAEQSTMLDGAKVELNPHVQQSEILSEPLTPSVNTGKLDNETMSSESKIEHTSNLLGDISSAPCDFMTESTFVQTVVSSEASEKLTSNSDSINGTLDLDIKSMPIDIDVEKEEGPNLEIMVGLHPFETVPGARFFEVHLRRMGEPFPRDIQHLDNCTLPYDAKKSNYSNKIYGLKKVPFPKLNVEGKDDNPDKEDASCINDFNNNPKKLIIPLGTLNLEDDDRSSLNVKLDNSKTMNPLKVSDKMVLPKQVLVTMPKNIQAEHFKVPGQGSKFTAKGTGKVLVCNSRTQIKNFTPGRMMPSLVTTSKPIKQFSISKNAGVIQSKPTNIILNGSSIHSIQVTGNVQQIIPVASSTKQIEKEKPTTAKLQHSPTKKTLTKHSPNLLQRGAKKTGRQFVLEKSNKIPAQSVETPASTNSPTVVCNLPTSRSDQVLLLDLGKPTKVIRVQTPKTVIKTSGQDILAEAIANTNVLQSDLDGSEFVGTSLSNNVLETSLTLNQPPIMSPLEVPSSVTSPSVPILATDQPTIYFTTPYVIDSSTPIVLAPAGDSSGIEGEDKLVFSGVTEQQKVAVSEDKDNVLPEFLKGDFSKKSPKKCDSSNNR